MVIYTKCTHDCKDSDDIPYSISGFFEKNECQCDNNDEKQENNKAMYCPSDDPNPKLHEGKLAHPMSQISFFFSCFDADN